MTRWLFASDTRRRLPRRVLPAESTSAPLRFWWLRQTKLVRRVEARRPTTLIPLVPCSSCRQQTLSLCELFGALLAPRERCADTAANQPAPQPCQALQFCLHCVAFPGRVQFGENIEAAVSFSRSVLRSCCSRASSPRPVAVSQRVLVAQLQSSRGLPVFRVAQVSQLRTDTGPPCPRRNPRWVQRPPARLVHPGWRDYRQS